MSEHIPRNFRDAIKDPHRFWATVIRRGQGLIGGPKDGRAPSLVQRVWERVTRRLRPN